MITATVNKMGNQRYVSVTNTKLKLGQLVSLKPKGLDVRVLKKVVKQGDRKIVIIPQNYWDYFKHDSEVYIRKVRKR